jgi:outer membrane protein assembly factor BamB
MKRCSLAVIVVLLCAALVYAADAWPEFRGPTGQGHVEKGSLPTEWSKTKNVAWVQTIPGVGWSSPVIADNRIYLTTGVPIADTKDTSLRALCLDAKEGKILWSEEVFKEDGAKAPGINGKNSHASPTPILHGERLYVHFGHEGTACLDLNGKVLWRQTGLRYKPVHGNGGSPIIVDDLLVFSIDGSDKQIVVALELKTGDVRWKTDRKSTAFKTFSFHTPLLIDVDGKKQIVSVGSDMVGGYDPKTGAEIWRVHTKGYSVIPRPVYGHGLVFLSTGYDTPSLVAIRPDGKGDVTETHVKWMERKGAPHTPSPLLVGDELYVVSDGGVATCLDAKTGMQHWQQRLGGAFSASPIYADGKIYFQNERGVGYVVKADKQFELLAKNDLEERSLASYAAADGALFIRTEEHLYRIETKK